ncbi:MAG: tRNA threonylcarbamoyladenosine dehydratase [Bacteroidales bacterium]|nr:tRNA threonylcarbamoyladenosine dehydratase [Bacteroidales bacterium]MBO5977954.1 tRNA threonylcarbamoyladenosine dehydratase [Bacteroidales bacterium]
MAWTQKTEYLVGAEKLQTYAAARVLVVGVGGVGAFVAEFLARAGIGFLTLVDGDVVSDSNRNRQLLALCSTEAQVKVEVMARRLQDINPQLQLETRQMWLTPENVPALLEEFSYDFVVDAIDDVPAKVALLKTCLEKGLRVVSAMGAAGKYDPTLIQQADISKSYHCGLAKAVRKRLSQQEGIKSGIPVVFSPEPTDLTQHPGNNGERVVPGTMPYMPAAFACHLAAYVLKQL